MRYKAIAPAVDKDGKLCYSEKTLGVQFNRGLAHFDDVTLAEDGLGRSAEEIAFALENDFGYQVIRMNDDGSPYVEPEPDLEQAATGKKKK